MTTPLVTDNILLNAVNTLRSRALPTPRIGLITGSGLGGLADEVADAVSVPYGDIPGMADTTVDGHSGHLVFGRLAEQPVVVMRGRLHFYEGHSLQAVTFPIRLMRALGADSLLVTNAAGAVNEVFNVGDLMVIRDHVFLPGMAGHNPLRGPNDPAVGPRFPSMIGAYDRELRRLAHRVGSDQNIMLEEGIYAMVAGPSFETPAEIRFLRAMGADAVGMSTCPEVVVARHAGLRVLGISLMTNICVDTSEGAASVGETEHEGVLAAAAAAVPRFSRLVRALVAAM
ncbi:MAG: purine nucleoside phosphorylase I, inosine and guanosine-specific [Anaerolineae bacterium]